MSYPTSNDNVLPKQRASARKQTESKRANNIKPPYNQFTTMAAVAPQEQQQHELQQAPPSYADPQPVFSTSNKGYGDRVHNVLISIGSTIHKVVGEPSAAVVDAMNQIGNWFQEASYAARDLKQGNMNMREETMQAVKLVVSGE
jgi:hypothetical protein